MDLESIKSNYLTKIESGTSVIANKLIPKNIDISIGSLKYCWLKDNEDIHLLTNHGGMDQMQAALLTLCDVSSFAIRTMIASCNVCCAPYGMDSMAISLREMPECNGFKFLLICVFLHSNFVILRPFLDDSNHEVTFELIRIFIDFGVPTKLKNHLLCEDYNIIKKLWPQCPTPETSLRHSIYACHDLLQKIKDQSKLLCKSWPLIAPQVQYNENRIKKQKKSQTEMQSAFDITFKSGLPVANSIVSSSWGRMSDGVSSSCSSEDESFSSSSDDEPPVSKKLKNFRLCVVCNKAIYAVKYCNRCTSAVHFYCSRRVKIFPEECELVCKKCDCDC